MAPLGMGEVIVSGKGEDQRHMFFVDGGILQVHDELVYEVKDALVGESIKRFKRIMEKI